MVQVKHSTFLVPPLSFHQVPSHFTQLPDLASSKRWSELLHAPVPINIKRMPKVRARTHAHTHILRFTLFKQRDKELEKEVQRQILSAAQPFSLTICITSTKTLAKWPLIVASTLPGGKVFVNGRGRIEGRVFGLKVGRNQRCTSDRQARPVNPSAPEPGVPSHQPSLQHSFTFQQLFLYLFHPCPHFLSRSLLQVFKEISTLTLLTSPYYVSTLHDWDQLSAACLRNAACFRTDDQIKASFSVKSD